MMSSTPETDLEYSATDTGGDQPAAVVVEPSDPAGAAAGTARKPRASRRIPKSDAVLEAAVERARLGLLEVAPEIRPQVEAELAAEHERIAGGVDKAVELGVVDEVVAPSATRRALASAIVDAGIVQRGRHGNIPL